MDRMHPDLTFVQMDPSNFMARQRFLSHKSALKGVEDYDVKAIQTINPEKPHSWEECVVNLTVLDMLNENKTEPELDLTTGLSIFSYHEMRPKTYDLVPASQKFVSTINKNIIGRDFSEFNIINQTLYKALMGKQKVILGDMSEILYRRILGNSLSLNELKDVFRFLTEKLKKMDEPVSYREAAHNFLPHIFQMPRDLYMTALLKESFQAATSVGAFIGAHHYVPIQRYWIGPPYGVNFSQATRVPDRVQGERDEELIEKQALLDSLLEKKAWGQGYVVNPFSYLSEDLTSFSDRDISALKDCFLFHYKKYEKFKKINADLIGIPSYKDQIPKLMAHRGTRDEELQLQLEEDRINEELRDDVHDLSQLKLDYWKKSTAKNQGRLEASQQVQSQSQ